MKAQIYKFKSTAYKSTVGDKFFIHINNFTKSFPSTKIYIQYKKIVFQTYKPKKWNPKS